MNVDDIYLVLYHHWVLDATIYPDGRQRLQVSFLILISAYTATRPGALVYVARNVKEQKGYLVGDKDDKENTKISEMDDEMVKAFLGHSDGMEPVKTLCYEDVSLLLLPNPTGTRDLLALEVDLRYTKGHQRQTKRLVIYLSFFATTC